MFKISPIQDEKTKKDAAEKCGAVAREGFFAYAMVDQDTNELMGMSQFEIEGEIGYISDLRSATGYEDYEAMFILGRATMNFIDMCGSHKCRADKAAAEERLLHAIGFRETDGELFCDMTGMFDGHCSGEAVKL